MIDFQWIVNRVKTDTPCSHRITHMGNEPQTAAGSPRYIMLDALRGGAILLMIFFHFAYDLNLFRFIRIDLFHDPFWFTLPRVIVSLFLICVGISLAIVHQEGIRWDKVGKRAIKIGGWAVVITVVTYVLFPKSYVYFGVLHCIAVSSVAGVFFVNRPKLSLCLGSVFVLSHMIFQPTLLPLSKWLKIHPMDHVPFYPWFGWVLIGIYLNSIRFHHAPLKKTASINLLGFLGRHSLLIYILHRPILYGTVLAVYRFKTAS